MTEIKNIIIIGKEGKEKARVANILLNKNDNFEEVFPERKEGDSSRNEPYQIEEAVVDGITYRIIDIIGLEDEIKDEQEFIRGLKGLAKEIEKDGINQLIFTFGGDDIAKWNKGKILKEEFFDLEEDMYRLERIWWDADFLKEIVENDTLEFKEKTHKEMWNHSNQGKNIPHGLKHYQEVKFFPKCLENFLEQEKITNVMSVKNLKKEQERLIIDEKVAIASSEPYQKPIVNMLLENWDKFRIDQFEDEEKFKELIAKIFKFIPDNEKWFRFPPEFLEKLQEVFKEKQEIFKKQSASLKELAVGDKWIEVFERSHSMSFFVIGEDEQWLSREITLEEKQWNQIIKMSSLLENRIEKEQVKKSVLEITPQDLIVVERDKKNFLELVEKGFKSAEIISSNGYLFSREVLEFLQLSLKGENLTVVYEKGAELTIKEFVNDKLELNRNSIKVFLNDDVCKKLERLERSRNILLMGRTGAGKSSLGNLLLDKEEVFKTSASSISQTKGYQAEIFEDGIISYQIIDMMGIGDTQLSEESTLYEVSKVTEILNRGIHQVLFVIKGRFTAEEVKTFEMLEAIFKSKVVSHCTIVRTRFRNFQDPDTSEKDFNNLIDEEGKAKPILEKIGAKIFYVDNPPLVGDENRIAEFKKTREAARRSLLTYLRTSSRATPYALDLNSEFLDRRIKGYLDPFEKEMWKTEKKLKKLAKKLPGSEVNFWVLKNKLESKKSELEKKITELFILWEKLWLEKDEEMKKKFDELKKEVSEVGLDEEELKEKNKKEFEELEKIKFPAWEELDCKKFDEMCSLGVEYRRLYVLLVDKIKKQIEGKIKEVQIEEKKVFFQEKKEAYVDNGLTRKTHFSSSEEIPERSTIEKAMEELLLDPSNESLRKSVYLLPEEINELRSLQAEINKLEKKLVEFESQGIEVRVEVPPK